MGGSSVEWWSMRKLKMYLEKERQPYDPSDSKEQLIKRVKRAIANRQHKIEDGERAAKALARPRTTGSTHLGPSGGGGGPTTPATNSTARGWEHTRGVAGSHTLPGVGGGTLASSSRHRGPASGGGLAGGQFSGTLAAAGRRTSMAFAPQRPLRSSRRICFLDVDGVLNTHHNGRSLSGRRKPNESLQTAIQNDIHQSNLKRLVRCVKECGSVIVLSSAWRLVEDHCRVITANLRNEGLSVIASTGLVHLGSSTADGKIINCVAKARCVEIMQWLAEFGDVESWVAVDDMDLWTAGGPSFKGHFVQTKPHFGLTDADADQLVRLMGGPGRAKGGSGRRAGPVVVPPQLTLSKQQPSDAPGPRRRGIMRLFF